MVEDLSLDLKHSKTCRLSDLDTLFLEVNAASYRHAQQVERETQGKLTGKARQQVERMKDTGLSRPEFLAVLIGMAVKRFVEASDSTKVTP